MHMAYLSIKAMETSRKAERPWEKRFRAPLARLMQEKVRFGGLDSGVGDSGSLRALRALNAPKTPIVAQPGTRGN